MEQTEAIKQNEAWLADVKGKKGLNLMVKLMLALLSPLIVITIFSILSMNSVDDRTASHFIETERDSVQEELQVYFDDAADGAYHLENGALYKGDMDVTSMSQILDPFGESMGVDIGLYWGTDLVVSNRDGAAYEISASRASSVLDSIDELNEISQNNAASTQETAATMDHLSQVVDECRKATSQLVEISNELTSNANRFKLK